MYTLFELVQVDLKSYGYFSNIFFFAIFLQSVDEVAQATILPKAEIAAKQGIESEMLTAVAKKKAYFFDYVQSTSVQPKTHFRTIFSLAQGATGGAGSLLVSITVQTPESDYAAMEPLFQKILDSYESS